MARCHNLHSAPYLHVSPQTCLLVSPSPSFPAYSWLVVLVLVAAPLLYWSAFAICAPTAYHHITLYVLHQAHRSFLNITTTMLAPPQLPHRTRTGLRPTDCLHHAAHSLNTMAYTQVAQATLKVPQRSGSVHGCIKKTPHVSPTCVPVNRFTHACRSSGKCIETHR